MDNLFNLFKLMNISYNILIPSFVIKLFIYEISEINSETENDRIFLFDLENRYFKNNSIQNTLDYWGESY